ncbi:hypothetical protein EMCRGX_G030390 [Ephydatia muelleri]
MDGERQEKASIKVNGKGQINGVIKDLEAREEINSEGRKESWGGRKRKLQKSQYRYEEGGRAGEKREGGGDKGKRSNSDNGVNEGGNGRAAKVAVGGKKGGVNGEGGKEDREGKHRQGKEREGRKSKGRRGKGILKKRKGIGTWLFMMPMVSLFMMPMVRLFMLLLVIPSGINASVVIAPSHDYTTFENNVSIVTLYCFGNGAYLLWTVDGYTTGSSYVLSKEIQDSYNILSPDGLTLSSQLIVPNTKASNNITVICIVQDLSFNHQSGSNPVKLFLQGILPPPQHFNISISNNSAHISWVAPESLQVSTPPTISHYVLSNNLTNGKKTFNNPTTCNTMASCNYSIDVRDPYFTIVGSHGGVNTTIFDYNAAILFTLFAVNGAGNGSVAAYIYMYELPKTTASGVEAHPSQTVPTTDSTSYTDFGSTNATSTMSINEIIAVVPAIVIAFILVITTVVMLRVIIVHYFKIRKRVLILPLLLVGLPSGTNASVVIAPSHDYTTFENNASMVTFNCFGNGAYLLWTVDGYTTGSSYVLNKEIQDSYYILSPDGLAVSSQLIVPTTKANNNITVICIVQDVSFNHQSGSNPVKLFLQGILPPPQHFKMSISNNSAHISWVAPESLQVSTPPTISHYVLSNNQTNGTKTFNNPTTCNTMASCNYSIDVRDPYFTIVGSHGGVNTTIFDYNAAILFTLFAVNGAGNGSVAAYIYMYELPKTTASGVEAHPSQTVPTTDSTSYTDFGSTNATSTMSINDIIYVVPAVIVVFILLFTTVVVLVIHVVVHYFKKRKGVLFLHLLILLGLPSGTNASVIIAPSHDYTTFENNASMLTFNCSGNGAYLLWTVDGYTTGSSYVLSKEIQDSYYMLTPDGLTVSSQLIVPTTKANNNITVICIVLDLSFNHQSGSNPVKLFLQGVETHLSQTVLTTVGTSYTAAGSTITTSTMSIKEIIAVVIVLVFIPLCTTVVVLAIIVHFFKKRRGVLFLYLLLLGIPSGTNACVVIQASHDYTTFKNNISIFTYNCSGNGKSLMWIVDEHTARSSYVLKKEIQDSYYILSSDGLAVTSQLIVPTTKANNNITVIYIVQDLSYNHPLRSNLVQLYLQDRGGRDSGLGEKEERMEKEDRKGGVKGEKNGGRNQERKEEKRKERREEERKRDRLEERKEEDRKEKGGVERGGDQRGGQKEGGEKAMRLALQPKGNRTEALTRTDEMESLIALMMEDIRGRAEKTWKVAKDHGNEREKKEKKGVKEGKNHGIKEKEGEKGEGKEGSEGGKESWDQRKSKREKGEGKEGGEGGQWVAHETRERREKGRCRKKKGIGTWLFTMPLVRLFMMLQVISSSVNAGVDILPSHDYTTFENNASTFLFNCSGNETNLLWTVDGEMCAATAEHVFDNGIQLLAAIVDGLNVSSQLIVPTTKANNNTTVKCTVLDSKGQSSDLVTLFLQGILPYHSSSK